MPRNASTSRADGRRRKSGCGGFGAIVFIALAFIMFRGSRSCAQQGGGSAPSGAAQPESEAISRADAAWRPAEPEDAAPALTRNFYFIVDGSGSMAAAMPGSGASRLDVAKGAVESFLRSVPQEGVQLGLYAFDDGGRGERVPLGAGDRAAFLHAVQGMRAGGGTPLADAIRHGVRRLAAQSARQLGYGEVHLVVVTDGEAKGLGSAAGFAEVQGVPIRTIAFALGGAGDHSLRRHSLSYRRADSAAELQSALEAIVAEAEEFDPAVFEALEEK